MALAFNGTTSKLEYVGNAVGTYPYTQFIWVKMRTAALSGNCSPISAGQWGAGTELSILTIGSSQVRAQVRDGSASNFAATSSAIADEVWIPAMAVFVDDHNRWIYWGSETPVQETTTNSPSVGAFDRLRIGVRAFDDSLWSAMDAAHAAVWSAALTAGNFTSMAAGAVPNTISSGSLFDYWTLATQASTQTGVNGHVMTATSTSQASTDPLSSPDVTLALTGVSSTAAVGTLSASSPGTAGLTGVEATSAVGSMASSVLGSAALIGVAAAVSVGSLSLVGTVGRLIIGPLKNNTTAPQPNVSGIQIKVYDTAGAHVIDVTGTSDDNAYIVADDASFYPLATDYVGFLFKAASAAAGRFRTTSVSTDTPAPSPPGPAPPPPAPPPPAPSPSPAPAPAVTGLINAIGSNITSKHYDNGIVDRIDMTKALPTAHWVRYTDDVYTVARSMEGAEPTGYTVLNLFGQPNQLYDGIPALIDTDADGVGDTIVQVDPNFGEFSEGAATILASPTNDHVQGHLYPLRGGVRHYHVMTPYTTWHGHNRRLTDGSLSLLGLPVPMFIGITVLGDITYLLRDGSSSIPFRIPGVKSYTQDFSFFEPRVPRWLFAVDTGVGELIKVDMSVFPFVTTVHASGWTLATSCRAVNGFVYVADATAGTVTKVDPVSGAKTLVCSLTGAFWLDYFSNGDLVCMTKTRAVHRISLPSGTVGPDMQPPEVLVPSQPFVQCDVDRFGTFGEVDGIIGISVTGEANIDFYRFHSDGTVKAMFDYNFGAMTLGEVVHVADAIGHYPWVAIHHPNDGVIAVQGFGNTQLSLIQANHPSDTWPGLGSYGDRYTAMELGKLTIERGYDPVLSSNPGVPSYVTCMNANGGSFIGSSADQIARLPTFADMLNFIRHGMMGSYRRFLSAATERAVLTYILRNSERGLVEGEALLLAAEAYCDAHPPIAEPAWLAGKPFNAWFEITGTTLGTNSILAFCGAANKHGELFLAASGGHGDSSDNGVRSINFNVDAPAWVLRKAPSTPTYNVDYYADGTPSSRHTYWTSHWSDLYQRIFLFGNLSPYGPGGTFFRRLDGFNTTANTWDAAGTWPDASNIDCLDKFGNGWSMKDNDGFGCGISKWDAVTKVQTTTLDFPEAPAGHPLCYDTYRDQLVSLSWGHGEDFNQTETRCFKYTGGGTVRTAITLVGSGIEEFAFDRTEYGAMEYDSTHDRFLFYDGRNFGGINRTGRIYVLKPNDSLTWTLSIMPLDVSSPLPPPTMGAGILNRFRYIQELQVVVAISDGVNNCFARRV